MSASTGSETRDRSSPTKRLGNSVRTITDSLTNVKGLTLPVFAKRRRNGTRRNKTHEAEPFRKSRPVKIDLPPRLGYRCGTAMPQAMLHGRWLRAVIALETDKVPSMTLDNHLADGEPANLIQSSFVVTISSKIFSGSCGAPHGGLVEPVLLCERKALAGRVREPTAIARPRSSLVLREHDSSGVLTFKSARGKP